MATLTFDRPAPPVSANQRLHWAKQRRMLAPWRQATYYTALASRRSGELAGVVSVPCTVTVTLPFPDRRRRDPHNYVAPLVKTIVDELVRAGVWPDDTPEWVSVAEPRLVVGKPLPPVTVELVPR